MDWLKPLFSPNCEFSISKMVIPSERGELEITSFNSIYFNKKKLKLQVMSCVYAWLDPCTHESMTEATEFVKVFEKLTNLKNACIEEIVL